MTPLIGTELLVDHLDDYRICDTRWALADPDKGRADYLTGHLPGAIFVDLDTDLAAPPGERGRHPLPSIEDFAATLGRLGVGSDTRVVAYDDSGGRVAARLWWMLVSIGHREVKVLDGGVQAWVSCGGDLEAGDRSATPTTYEVPAAFSGVVDIDTLAGRALVDARAEERYRGDVEPVDPKAGHIPGAVNIPTDLNLRPDGLFRSPAELTELYRGLQSQPVMSCGSGVNACHDALAMVVAGHDVPDIYVGSFSEWSRGDFPVATGSEP